MSASIPLSRMAATLVVDGALAMIAGAVQGQAPVESVPLTPEDRKKAGLDTPGETLFFPAGEAESDGVFFDMAEDRATIWYNGGDFEQGLGVLEAALKRSHPATKYLGETPNAKDPSMRSRTYEIDFGQGRLAVLDVSFTPLGGAGRRQFAVRVFAKKKP